MLQVVFDDTLAVPEAIGSVVGVRNFGDLVFQRRSRVESMRALANESGWPPIIHLCDADDVSRLIDRLRQDRDDTLYLMCPSYLFPACGQEKLATFLKQVEYAPSALHMPLVGARDYRGWSLMPGYMLEKFLIKQREDDLASFFEQHGRAIVDVPGRLRLIDLSDERTLQDVLSGQFDARHFNSVERDEYTVVKRSKDRAKLKREFDFFHLVPPALRMFFVEPFDFQDDGTIASYRMERISVPDMALQWLHDGFQPQEFERFLKHLFYFISVRPEIRVEKNRAMAAWEALYVTKVEERIAMLKRLPDYARLVPLFESGFGGLDRLVTRYFDVLRVRQKRFPLNRLVLGHGDPCFSNILYSKTNQFLKLIDPKGGSREDELYTDPYYDVAKISHSVLGSYDFINHDMCDIGLDSDLRLSLTIREPAHAWAPDMFLRQIEQASFDPVLTRLCEASLFISMLPLHIDRPRKVLAFALRASTILDEITGVRELPT